MLKPTGESRSKFTNNPTNINGCFLGINTLDHNTIFITEKGHKKWIETKGYKVTQYMNCHKKRKDTFTFIFISNAI